VSSIPLVKIITPRLNFNTYGLDLYEKSNGSNISPAYENKLKSRTYTTYKTIEIKLKDNNNYKINLDFKILMDDLLYGNFKNVEQQVQEKIKNMNLPQNIDENNISEIIFNFNLNIDNIDIICKTKDLKKFTYILKSEHGNLSYDCLMKNMGDELRFVCDNYSIDQNLKTSSVIKKGKSFSTKFINGPREFEIISLYYPTKSRIITIKDESNHVVIQNNDIQIIDKFNDLLLKNSPRKLKEVISFDRRNSLKLAKFLNNHALNRIEMILNTNIDYDDPRPRIIITYNIYIFDKSFDEIQTYEDKFFENYDIEDSENYECNIQFWKG
jgi:hypothetical protein